MDRQFVVSALVGCLTSGLMAGFATEWFGLLVGGVVAGAMGFAVALGIHVSSSPKKEVAA